MTRNGTSNRVRGASTVHTTHTLVPIICHEGDDDGRRKVRTMRIRLFGWMDGWRLGDGG